MTFLRGKDVDAGLQRLYDALETGRFTPDELAPRIRALVAEEAELQSGRQESADALLARRLGIQDMEVMRGYPEDLRALLGSGSSSEQKAFLKSFVYLKCEKCIQGVDSC